MRSDSTGLLIGLRGRSKIDLRRLESLVYKKTADRLRFLPDRVRAAGGLEVAAWLKGRLPSTDMFPVSGNAIGDTWVVGDSAWVWVAAPGTGSANWIDP
jgi:hypothetical protein